jgi:hypothetical protein
MKFLNVALCVLQLLRAKLCLFNYGLYRYCTEGWQELSLDKFLFGGTRLAELEAVPPIGRQTTMQKGRQHITESRQTGRMVGRQPDASKRKTVKQAEHQGYRQQRGQVGDRKGH